MQRIIGYGVAVAIAIAVLGYKFSQKDDQGEEVREQMIMLIASLPDMDTHGSLYDKWLDAHHDQVFEKHHRMGGRRSSTSFDGDAYLTDLFNAMASQAATEGYEEQAQNLRDLRAELSWDDEDE